MALILDAKALISIDEHDRKVGALLRVAQRNAVPVRTSAAVIAQVWRNGSRQANLARTLVGVQDHALDQAVARRIGELLRDSATADVVDAHVAILTKPGDTVLTSDVNDIGRLLDIRHVQATVQLI